MKHRPRIPRQRDRFHWTAGPGSAPARLGSREIKDSNNSTSIRAIVLGDSLAWEGLKFHAERWQGGSMLPDVSSASAYV